jgi:hypothetical protein
MREGVMTHAIATIDSPARCGARWIISRNADLVWFIGGSFAGYLLFYLHAGLKLDMLAVWFLWMMLFDVPHFFGTYSRTYFDRVEWHHRRRLLGSSLAWLVVGPAVIGLCALLYRADVRFYQAPLIALAAVASVWAYVHVTRQHFGIMRLYARKNDDARPADRWIDGWAIHLGLLAPAGGFLILHPEVRAMLGRPPELLPLGRLLLLVSVAITVIAVGMLVARQFILARRGVPLNLPKLLYLAAVIPFYAFVCYHPATRTAPLLGFVAFVTISHDIHYQALVWFHHRNRYHARGVDPRAFGLASLLSRNLPTYLGCAVGASAVLMLLSCSLEVTPGCSPLIFTSQWKLYGDITSRELLMSLIFGLQMHHYFLDQFIWRPSQDEDLVRDLKLLPESIA